jgi:putative ABC transport system substrate-binding protein
MKRREFITLIGGAAATWPLGARAQHKMPVIGWVNVRPEWSGILAEARRGLAEYGYIEGRDFTFEYRFAQNYQPAALAANALELVQRDVAVIFAITMPETLAAKAATKSIPIIFQVGVDPVATGLVTSLSRPGGNLTGASMLNIELVAKRLQILHEMVPTATSIAYLVNSDNQVGTDTETNALQLAASALGIHILVLNVTETSELDGAFTTLTGERVGAVFVGSDAIFLRSRNKLAALAARYAMPTIYANRDYMLSGGVGTGCLISYGTYYGPGYRIMGNYAARVLKGEKPSDLPVQQVTKTDLIINLKTAKELGLAIPPTLLATADEVIE